MFDSKGWKCTRTFFFLLWLFHSIAKKYPIWVHFLSCTAVFLCPPLPTQTHWLLSSPCSLIYLSFLTPPTVPVHSGPGLFSYLYQQCRSFGLFPSSFSGLNSSFPRSHVIAFCLFPPLIYWSTVLSGHLRKW